MSAFICTTCGTQYQPSQTPPDQCLICDDERQFIPEFGQTWTTLNTMRESNIYCNQFTKDENGIFSIVTQPAFAIGQTAFMLQTGDFNLLWDCITYLDDRTIEEIQTMGGIDAIALSHPHY
ncbi:MAG: hydrolase [Firmicutes bacterium]|nr:hydrolase [Bacillota bacterium]